MLCRIDRGRVTFWSRNGKDWTEKFQNVLEAIKSLKATSAMLDGEIVIVDAQGRSSFQKLQRAMGKATTTGFAYEVFDLIYLDGFSLTQIPLKHRKEILKNLVGSNSRGIIRYSEHINGSGDEVFKRRINAKSKLAEGEVCDQLNKGDGRLGRVSLDGGRQPWPSGHCLLQGEQRAESKHRLL
jgi:bifunctional non-homologous end joining protein LigD